MDITEVTKTISELDNICKLLLGKNQLDNQEKENLLKRLEKLRDYLSRNFSSEITQLDLYKKVEDIQSNLSIIRNEMRENIRFNESYAREMHGLLMDVRGGNVAIIKILDNITQYQNTSPLSPRNLVTPVGRSARGEGINYLKEFTKDARELIIIDPYIFIVKSEDYIDAYLKEFFDAINIRTNKNNIESIRIIYDKWEPDISDIIRDTMYSATNPRKIFKLKASKKIHDRIWIKNKKSAMFVGTSFNGLGNKLNVLLPLPEDDLRNVLDFLNSENLLNDQPRRIISI
ncbi:hypothetical protein NIES2101_40820 [Calothrix sp. HK-06]|nr:hypothetical protein NIES2101_40820 [Calothrix sp. HK-06]